MNYIKLIQQRMMEATVKVADIPTVDDKNQMEIKVHHRFDVKFHNDGKHCAVLLKCELKSTEEPAVVSVSVSYEGIFETDEIRNDEDKKRIHVQAYYSIFPYMQAMISNIFVSTGLPPIIIQPMEMKTDEVSLSD